jgi:hypothetical protein
LLPTQLLHAYVHTGRKVSLVVATVTVCHRIRLRPSSPVAPFECCGPVVLWSGGSGGIVGLVGGSKRLNRIRQCNLILPQAQFPSCSSIYPIGWLLQALADSLIAYGYQAARCGDTIAAIAAMRLSDSDSGSTMTPGAPGVGLLVAGYGKWGHLIIASASFIA